MTKRSIPNLAWFAVAVLGCDHTPTPTPSPSRPDIESVDYRRKHNLKTDYDHYKLRCPTADEAEIVSAMGVVLTCRGKACDLFDVESNPDTLLLPVAPHCGKRYDCKDHSSFSMFADDHIIKAKLEGVTASFIGDDVIITAKHGVPDNVEHTYFLMDQSHTGRCTWNTVDIDNDQIVDHVEVKTDAILSVTKIFASEAPKNGQPPDWVIAKVEPLRPGAVIPEHSHFELSASVPDAETEILVPSHPRMLPLKIADGVIDDPGDLDRPLRAIFDSSNGSSGAPILLASDRTSIVGINRGSNRPTFIAVLGSTDLQRARRCTRDRAQTSDLCQAQPATAAIRIIREYAPTP